MDSTTTPLEHPSQNDSGTHKPFLERAAEESGFAEGLGLGAFLVMRLVDQFAVGVGDWRGDALEYQCSSTRSFVAGIQPPSELSSLLYEVTRVAEAALETEERRLLFPPLLALAHHLEEDYRLNEALDVLQSALCLSDGRDAEEELGLFLRRGRLLRNINDFAAARSDYRCAGAMAARLADRHSELLSRIGLGIVSRQTGNLPESERTLEAVIADSRACSDGDAEARACQDLACTLYFAGRTAEATPLAFRAYEIFEGDADKARALSDTGVMLKALGHYSAAMNAYSLVLSHSLRPDVRIRTEIECMEVSALTGDRVSFERWRRSIDEHGAVVPKDARLDFEIQLGTGFAAFEEYTRAEEHLEQAIALGEELGMGERLFFAENQLAEVRQRRVRVDEAIAAPAGEGDGALPLKNTIERLEDLIAATSA